MGSDPVFSQEGQLVNYQGADVNFTTNLKH